MGSEEIIPLSSDKSGVEVVNMDQFNPPEKFRKNPFGETFNADFWEEVCIVFAEDGSQNWSGSMHRVRVKRIKEAYVLLKVDPVVTLITEVFDRFKAEVEKIDIQMMSSFKQQLSVFVKLLLEEDKETKHYTKLLPMANTNVMMTVLHLAAERDLVNICYTFVTLYPNSVYVTTNEDKDRLPIELAMEKKMDNVASYLAGNMLHERVRGLFMGDEYFDARFKLADFIKDPNMTKFVISILECCINIDWPFTPVEEGQKVEEAWSRIADTPTLYHFYYRLLDGDNNSEPAKIEGKVNPEFKHKQLSCLQLLASTPHSQVTMYHPVVRNLVDRKWANFGRQTIRLRCLLYMIFLVFLTLSLFAQEDTTSGGVKTLRNVCEVVTMVFVLGYIFNEIDEMEKERLSYLKDLYNYLDLIGLLLILLILPFRFTDNPKTESGMAALAYLVNCLRVFKYFPAFQAIGIYSKTIANIIKYDMSKFALVFVVVVMAFGGSIFLSMRATGTMTYTLKQIFLKEIRALAEGNPFADDYDNLNDGVTFLILLNMLVIIVILANILIGQLSARYEVAMALAGTQYSIDKTKFICRLEANRFRKWNKRIEYYQDGDYVSEEDRIKVLLSDWAAKKKEVFGEP